MSLRIITVIPAFKRPNAVLEAIGSVAAQTRPPDELVVVDDASPDETPRRIEAWLAEQNHPFPTRLVVQPENLGAAAARNRGIETADACDVITFLDDDDLWPVDYLRRVEDAFLARPEAIVTCCDRLNVDLESGRQQLRQLDDIEIETPTRLIKVGLPGIPNTAFRAEEFIAAGMFDPEHRIAEDYPVMLRLSLRGTWIHIPGAPVTVRRSTPDHATGAARLSKSTTDRRRTVARLVDRFIFEEGGRERVPDQVWRPRLGHMWFTAGRQLQELGRRQEASECYRRASQIRPLHLRSRLALWMCPARD